MRIVYQWKVLTQDGLVKDPEPYGPFYSLSYLNDTFYSESEALDALKEWKKLCGYLHEDYTLMSFVE